MSIEIACPSCAAQLSLPETLLGTQVRCVSCQTAFTASDPDSSLPPPISDASKTVENRTQEDKPADHKECPSCGVQVRRDMRRCHVCGARLSRLDWTETEERFRRDPVRRDCEPHRGGLVLALGMMGLIFFPLCAAIGLVLSICAWVMGRADLIRMRTGTMDREGESNSRIGMICGMAGVPLNILTLIGCVAFWVFLVPGWEQATPQPVQPRFGGPPVQKDWKGKKW